MTERANERAARHIVSSALRVEVLRHEDGAKNGQVDALIMFDEPAPLEVVADHEPAFNAQWAALEKVSHRIEVPTLVDAWTVQLARSASVKRVVRELPGLILELQDARKMTGEVGRPLPLPRALRKLGIQLLYPVDGPGGHVNLRAEGWGGSASGTVSEFVERVLAVADDVPRKLKAHRSAQKHAFIWATIGTDYGVQFQLENRNHPLPEDDPALPDGVTHVWVAGSFTSQGALAWFPERGWWRPEWRWPESEPLLLSDGC